MSSAVDFFFENMSRFEQLEHDQICRLADVVQTWQQHANGPDNAPYLVKLKGKAARDKIVRHNLRLIVHIWRKSYSNRLHSRHAGLMDAFQSAAIDLTRAAEKYQPSRSKFSTYAATWIHKGLKGYLSGEDRLIRIPSNNVHLIRAALTLIHDAQIDGRKRPTCEELVEELSKTRRNVPKPEVLKSWLDSYQQTNAVSYDQKTGLDGEDSMIDFLADETSTPDDVATDIADALNFLTDQERTIIEKRYLSRKPVRFSDIGDQLGISSSRAHQIEARALTALRNLSRVN